ncbi:hypothetical protein JTE90_014780 [Oedothorax gibbosus]|uniref:Endoplasmic reticulum junction formation protein lunapark n=1 Tax=Oedothorax gibbosus TaxID=931172 RepID=A0AAV6UB33_9ARAC|nr:hypothetical protein JTE90_014780 [Oedothorax gibbosus]
MGLYISRIRSLFSFKKSPDVYKKELVQINGEILAVEQTKATLEYQYFLITEFIVSYSRLLYIMVILVYFFSTLPSTFVEYLFFCGPVLIFYILVSVLKRSLRWYYDNEIKRNDGKLLSLHFRKKNLLSEVQENVTLQDAKNILEEFSPIKTQNRDTSCLPKNDNYSSKIPSFSKLFKYFFKEKENALICKHCRYHNGMALKEDYPYISFRCCRCLKFNPAKTKED